MQLYDTGYDACGLLRQSSNNWILNQIYRLKIESIRKNSRRDLAKKKSLRDARQKERLSLTPERWGTSDFKNLWRPLTNNYIRPNNANYTRSTSVLPADWCLVRGTSLEVNDNDIREPSFDVSDNNAPDLSDEAGENLSENILGWVIHNMQRRRI